MFEVEQKFAVDNFAGIERMLRERGAVLTDAVLQVDRYFAHPARDFARTDEALRIRQVGGENRITYKSPKLDAHTKTRREIELPLVAGDAHAEQFAALLQALSFSPVAVVRKHRRTANLSLLGFDVEVALDEVAGVGQFVEIEITADEKTLDAACSALAQLASQIGLSQSERRSYLELLLSQ